MKKQYYCAIDIAKIICAVLVVFIHTSPLGSVNGLCNSVLVNCISRVAVPFFFISSGFLLFSKTELSAPDLGMVGKYELKLLKFYLIWSAVYFPYTLLEMYVKRKSGLALSVFLNWMKNMVVTAGFGLLWYLPATIVAVGIVALLLKRGVKINTVVFIGFVLYLIGLCGQSYYGLAAKLPLPDEVRQAIHTFYNFIVTTRNGVFEGIIFIALGAKLSQKEEFGSLAHSLAGFFASSALLLFEFVFISKMEWRIDYDMYLSLVPCAYFMLKTALCLKWEIPPEVLRFLRPYSSLIYFTHMIPKIICDLFFPYLHSLVLFFGVFTVTLVIDTAIILLSRTKPFGFLKKIY